MLLYLAKSTGCLMAFVFFYKLILEKQNMHVFKRFYLLGSLVASLLIPLIYFTVYIEPNYVLGTFTPPIFDYEIPQTPIIEEQKINYWPTILWVIYCLGATLFLARFLVNLYSIVTKIRRNLNEKHEHFTHVLLKKLIQPHSFFKYIFLDKELYETKKIPQEVFVHEHAHAIQKHSLDIVFIEFLQVIFWFNPFIYLIKKNIKLNHEFLADQEVINHGFEAKNYQNILLGYSSTSTEFQLVSSINYPSIKKRFTLMKTHTSKTAIWLRSLIVLPLLAFLVYGFSERKEVIKETPIENSTTKLNTILEVKQSPLVLKLNGEKTSLASLKNDFEKIAKDKKIYLRIESYGKPLEYDVYYEIMNEIEQLFEYAEFSDGIKLDSDKAKVVPEGNGSFKILDKGQNSRIEPVTIFIEKNNHLKLNEQPISRENLISEVNKLNTFLTPEQKRKYVWAAIVYEDDSSIPFAKQIISDLRTIDIYNSGQMSTSSYEKAKANPYKNMFHVGETVEIAEKAYQEMMSKENMEASNSYIDSLNKSDSPWKVDVQVSDVEFIEDNTKEISKSEITPVLELKDGKMFLNQKETSLETLKQDFLSITSNQKADLKIETKGDISMAFITDLNERLKPYLGKILFSGDSIIEDRKIETLPEKENKVTNETFPLLILNKDTNINCNKCTVGLTKELIESLEISTNTKEKVTSFQIKFPGKPTELVEGNKLNAVTLKNLQNSLENDQIIIFGIKTGKQTLDSNVTIKIISVPPPPPPPIPANATPEQKVKYQKIIEEYNRKYKLKGVEMIDTPPPPPPKAKNSPEKKN